MFCVLSLGDVLGVAWRDELASSRHESPVTGRLSVPESLTLARRG
ncbi:hypothetical protein A2U01_0052581 [Trifolium medium]|uniref:Uncharacterized protein n=1 Tax=Trifolium medium TaxID=97028 RepID=A0A392R564_9FABA|nr:hypothetical protein [Trifolium medium]